MQAKPGEWRSLLLSPQYKNGVFQNFSFTPALSEGFTYTEVFKEMFNRPKNTKPGKPVPFVFTNLKNIQSDTPVVTWFGHSSYLISCRGYNILVDPVFSGYASPVKGMVKAFPGSNHYQVNDMPDIDLLIITHNHYDHLDRKTVTELASKTKLCCTSLGVGKTIARFTCNKVAVKELDWWETEKINDDVTISGTPGRHFSGRGLKRNGSLWSSFVLDLFGYRLFLGGDSGYDTHFKAIGEKFGPFDLAILECGQYNLAWHYIHMLPEETAQAAIELKAKVLLPVHWGKFALAYHPWNESPEKVTATAEALGLKTTTPQIGEPVVLDKNYPTDKWWRR